MKKEEVEERLRELGKILWSYRIEGEELLLESSGKGKFNHICFPYILNNKVTY